MTFMSAFGAAVARGREHHDVFSILGLPSWRERIPAVARRYGAYRYQDGVAERALFVLDENGVIYWSYLSAIGVNPGADGILRALESMQASGSQAQPSEPAKAVA